MENEEKIFRAWLLKYVKKDKKITGEKLAALIGAKGPTITAYHSGRIIDGERRFPSIPFEMRELILEKTGVSYKEMMETGRKEIQPELSPEILQRVQALEEKLSISQGELVAYKGLQNKTNHLIIDQFQNSKLAEEINSNLLELEKLDAIELKGINNLIKFKISERKKI